MIIHKGFGLDLGTTNSTASIIKNGKVVFALEGKAKNKTIPSIVAVRRNGQEVVGTVAKNEFYAGNPNAKKSIKREMGKQTVTTLNGTDYSPEEISSKIINFCKECLISTIGNDPNVVYDKVVITVPAYFTLAQKDATRKAGELAGLEVQMLLEEPTSAAINYALQNNIQNGLFFVFDLGGGTFDVSILEKIENIPTVLATAGNNFLGGDNFDYILARHFLNHLSEIGADVDDVEVDADNTKFRCLMFAAENAKKRLSQEETIEINVPDVFKDNSGVELYIEEFTRGDFNNLIKDKIETDVIKECDKALKILEEKYGKTLEDVTHILFVGGSTKIPYVKEVIEKNYCVTANLREVTSFEPDFSVSAGAGFIANSNGFVLTEDEKGIEVKMNAPYVIDGQIYITGNVVKGEVTRIVINGKKESHDIDVMDDKSFMGVFDAKDYSEKCTYNFFNNDECLDKVESDDNSTVDIIAPTPVQNETIAVEIIDIEKGSIEKFPILESGTFLPSETTEYFKINEYSSKQVILPIWEGNRKIFNLVIDLPSNAKIGSKLSVTTSVDLVSNVTLSVELEGKKLNGRYEYIDNSDNLDNLEADNYSEIFEERINYVEDSEKHEEYMKQKADLDRELYEAKSNKDENHYATVSEKYEKLVAEMPATPTLTEDLFDKVGAEIKSKITKDSNISEFDIDNLVFYGKRFLKKGDVKEAQKCLDELREKQTQIELTSSPSFFFEGVRIIVAQVIQKAMKYIESPSANQQIVNNINRELNTNGEKIIKIFQKYEDGKESPEMMDDAKEVLQLSSGLFKIVQQIAPADDEIVNSYRGLVSKA
ncbi:MAG: Hsp70 family protein [Bacillota bacterium]|jgi:molecular chaperone DnaK